MTKHEQTPTAIITGGSGYVGCAIAEALIERGWTPILLSRTPKPCKGAETISCDITNANAIAEAVRKVVKDGRQISACIHAAAPATIRKALIEMTEDSFDNEFAVSVRGAYLLARATAPHMPADSAFIGITTNTIESGRPVSGRVGAYLPAKEALRTLLRVLAHEMKGIRVYAVAPGVLPGGLNDDLPAPVRNLLSRQPDGTTASPRDTSDLVADLCTTPSTFPTGTSITVPARIATPL